MSDDLAARLLAEIADAEFEANGSHEPWCAREGRDRADGAVGQDECSCDRPDEIRRRCAADRKIVALHSKPWTVAYEGTVCDLCLIGWPCETLRLLAEGYGITAGDGA